MSTVHALFTRSLRHARRSADFLFTDAVTASAYGISHGADRVGRERAAQVEPLRRAYAAAGYGHGHRVGLLLENRPAFLLHWFALNALGVSVVPIHADLRAAELRYLIEHSEIVLAVALPAHALGATKRGGRAATLRHGHLGGRYRCCRARRALRRGASEPLGNDSECALLYTSGTTGRPKGCMLSNRYFLDAGRWYAGLGHLCTVRPDAERVITPLPLTHMNAMAFSTMVVLTAGGCLVQLDRFHPGSWWRSVRDSGATIVHYLGVMPAMLLSAAPSGDRPRARGAHRLRRRGRPHSCTRHSRHASAFRCSRHGR